MVLAVILISTLAVPSIADTDLKYIIVSSAERGLFLRVEPNGSGRLNYGSIPRYAELAAGTFDFSAIRKLILKRSQSSAESTDELKPEPLARFVYQQDGGSHLAEQKPLSNDQIDYLLHGACASASLTESKQPILWKACEPYIHRP
ncbi:hypothetical protein CF392_07005 [Tamilnaduibacter salinus]|uniref:Uncharacterized protein n=2 Tax=Tamilnaduibacter salinus TaxID=1484056 RepID=A0A2A2I4J3_9GAMM|nr:hypothetical protein CF392_07005 [Tamilnaduibacter salinus]